MRTRWALAALVCVVAGCRDAAEPREPAPHPNFRATYQGTLHDRLPYGAELRVVARASLPDEVRGRIEAALLEAATAALPCMAGIVGTAPVAMALDEAGAVVEVAVRSELLGDTQVGRCIADAFATMRVGAVPGAPVEITYPLRNLHLDLPNGAPPE